MFGRSGRAVISGAKKGAGKRKRVRQDDGDAAAVAANADLAAGRSLWKKKKEKKKKYHPACRDKDLAAAAETGHPPAPKAGKAAPAFEAGRSVAGGSSVKAKLKLFRVRGQRSAPAHTQPSMDRCPARWCCPPSTEDCNRARVGWVRLP